MKTLNKIVHRLTKKYIKHQGMTVFELKLHWQHIFTKPMSDKIIPQKLSAFYNKSSNSTGWKTYILHLNVDPSWALEVQHLQTEICQKINLYFGKTLIKDLRIQQQKIYAKINNDNQLPKKLVILDKNTEIKINSLLDNIDDPELTERLNKLGKILHASD